MRTFRDIQGRYREEIDYRIRNKDRGGVMIILAPHGGGIERGTSELARAIAGTDLSYYLFEGIMPAFRNNKKLHIPSTVFDEPTCLDLIGRFQTSLAIHGCRGNKPMIFIGGRDCFLRDRLLAQLDAKDYPVRKGVYKYAGKFRTNICNRTISGGGIQLELSTGFRKLLFEDWRFRKNRRSTTKLFTRLSRDLRGVIG